MTNPGSPARQLDRVELLVAGAYHEMWQLAEELRATPINRSLYGRLQAFLDRRGFAACDALDELAARHPDHQRARLETLLPGDGRSC